MNIKNKILFTPGPLNTSIKTKKKMLTDLGSRDIDFLKINKKLFKELLKIGNANNYVCVPIQGSGTFGLESTFSTLLNDKSNTLILTNGVYGNRIIKILKKIKKRKKVLKFKSNELISTNSLEKIIKRNKNISHVALVHCETSTGILNPLNEIALICKKYKKKLIVDAMSSFGGIKINIKKNNIDALISSSNKCLEGVPGFSFSIIKKQTLNKCLNNSNSLALDLYDQWKGFEKNGQWRFTPPTHTILALYEAINQFKKEGGINKRNKRYKKNYQTLLNGMKNIGFKCYLDEKLHSPIIICFKKPKKLNFKTFYNNLSKLGFVIYPGSITNEKTFRIGCIGNITSKEINLLLKGINKVLLKLKIKRF